MSARTLVLACLREEIQLLGPGRKLVAIDGVDGSGKTTFAQELAASMQEWPVLTIHADDFLNLREVRYQKGIHSPEGFWLDSYDYKALIQSVLTPLGRDGNGDYRWAATDHRLNKRLDVPVRHAQQNVVTLVEGMFLHRDELAGSWDYSIFLDVPFTETARRMSLRDGGHPDPEHASMRRYVGGQRLYFDNAHPWKRANRVLDYTNPQSPRILSADEISQK